MGPKRAVTIVFAMVISACSGFSPTSPSGAAAQLAERIEPASSGSLSSARGDEYVYARVALGSGATIKFVVTVFRSHDSKPLRTIGWEAPGATIVAVSPSGHLFVGHNGIHPFIVEYSPGGATLLRRIVTPGAETIDQLGFDKQGHLYVEEQVAFAIYMYSSTGKLLATQQNEPYPSSFALDSFGNLFRGSCCYIKTSPHAFLSEFAHGTLDFVEQFQSSDKWSPVDLASNANTLYVLNVLNRFPYRSTKAQISEYRDGETKPFLTFGIPDSIRVGPSKLLINNDHAYILFSRGFAEGAYVLSASLDGKSVRRVPLDGTTNPVDISFGKLGLYVADQPSATTGQINLYANGKRIGSTTTVACRTFKARMNCSNAPVFSVEVGHI